MKIRKRNKRREEYYSSINYIRRIIENELTKRAEDPAYRAFCEASYKALLIQGQLTIKDIEMIEDITNVFYCSPGPNYWPMSKLNNPATWNIEYAQN